MQKTLKNIGEIAFPFLVVLGFIHLSSVFLVAQGVTDRLGWILFQTLDLPFIFVALLYGMSKLALTLEEATGNLKVPTAICTSFGVLLFLIALYFNFALTDVLIG